MTFCGPARDTVLNNRPFLKYLPCDVVCGSMRLFVQSGKPNGYAGFSVIHKLHHKADFLKSSIGQQKNYYITIHFTYTNYITIHFTYPFYASDQLVSIVLPLTQFPLAMIVNPQSVNRLSQSRSVLCHRFS